MDQISRYLDAPLLALTGALLLLAAGCSDGDGECGCDQNGQFACASKTSIRSCDGCDWKTLTCDELCRINKGSGWQADPQKGCQTDSAGDGTCWCKEKPVSGMCTITWTITDTCDDGKSPQIVFQDPQTNLRWGPHTCWPAATATSRPPPGSRAWTASI